METGLHGEKNIDQKVQDQYSRLAEVEGKFQKAAQNFGEADYKKANGLVERLSEMVDEAATLSDDPTAFDRKMKDVEPLFAAIDLLFSKTPSKELGLLEQGHYDLIEERKQQLQKLEHGVAVLTHRQEELNGLRLKIRDLGGHLESIKFRSEFQSALAKFDAEHKRIADKIQQLLNLEKFYKDSSPDALKKVYAEAVLSRKKVLENIQTKLAHLPQQKRSNSMNSFVSASVQDLEKTLTGIDPNNLNTVTKALADYDTSYQRILKEVVDVRDLGSLFKNDQDLSDDFTIEEIPGDVVKPESIQTLVHAPREVRKTSLAASLKEDGKPNENAERKNTFETKLTTAEKLADSVFEKAQAIEEALFDRKRKPRLSNDLIYKDFKAMEALYKNLSEVLEPALQEAMENENQENAEMSLQMLLSTLHIIDQRCEELNVMIAKEKTLHQDQSAIERLHSNYVGVLDTSDLGVKSTESDTSIALSGRQDQSLQTAKQGKGLTDHAIERYQEKSLDVHQDNLWLRDIESKLEITQELAREVSEKMRVIDAGLYNDDKTPRWTNSDLYTTNEEMRKMHANIFDVVFPRLKAAMQARSPEDARNLEETAFQGLESINDRCNELLALIEKEQAISKEEKGQIAALSARYVEILAKTDHLPKNIREELKQINFLINLKDGVADIFALEDFRTLRDMQYADKPDKAELARLIAGSTEFMPLFEAKVDHAVEIVQVVEQISQHKKGVVSEFLALPNDEARDRFLLTGGEAKWNEMIRLQRAFDEGTVSLAQYEDTAKEFVLLVEYWQEKLEQATFVKEKKEISALSARYVEAMGQTDTLPKNIREELKASAFQISAPGRRQETFTLNDFRKLQDMQYEDNPNEAEMNRLLELSTEFMPLFEAKVNDAVEIIKDGSEMVQNVEDISAQQKVIVGQFLAFPDDTTRNQFLSTGEKAKWTEMTHLQQAFEEGKISLNFLDIGKYKTSLDNYKESAQKLVLLMEYWQEKLKDFVPTREFKPTLEEANNLLGLYTTFLDEARGLYMGERWKFNLFSKDYPEAIPQLHMLAKALRDVPVDHANGRAIAYDNLGKFLTTLRENFAKIKEFSYPTTVNEAKMTPEMVVGYASEVYKDAVILGRAIQTKPWHGLTRQDAYVYGVDTLPRAEALLVTLREIYSRNKKLQILDQYGRKISIKDAVQTLEKSVALSPEQAVPAHEEIVLQDLRDFLPKAGRADRRVIAGFPAEKQNDHGHGGHDHNHGAGHDNHDHAGEGHSASHGSDHAAEGHGNSEHGDGHAKKETAAHEQPTQPAHKTSSAPRKPSPTFPATARRPRKSSNGTKPAAPAAH